ncbi:MAG: c-type cytochrome, partial [Candidatus Eremiobacteraeota bacterium]|nr:c-type cytochrome [Candidatus Eremiobacteraeota bacterium]
RAQRALSEYMGDCHMKNRFLPGLLVGMALMVVLLLAGAYLGIKSGAMPANADAKPSNLERWAARTSLRVTVNRDAPKQANPVSLSDENLIAGIKLYKENCSVCHGTSAAEPSAIAQGLYQRAPQLAKDGVEDDSDGVNFWKITHGIRLTGMPAFSKTLTDEQRWQIALLLKHMDTLTPRAEKAWRAI